VKLENGRDPLKLPLKVEIKNEPGIDVGGVRKEYFSLVVKELFNPLLGLFKYNED
jgi:E3 ubiquitin-protein ligase HECTD2